jgi:hypothetical protein
MAGLCRRRELYLQRDQLPNMLQLLLRQILLLKLAELGVQLLELLPDSVQELL